ncbi:YARHG domain-containing protein [Marinifilum caeruleilacunae]|nr:YARHG domain-containing protein [Marinifilum caeruleilacunae]
MKNKILIISLFLIFFSHLTKGQIIGFEKIDDLKVASWIPKWTIEYQSVYHFGDSEMESEFILIFGHDKYYGQIKRGSWNDNGTSWIWSYENLTNIRIEKNKFYSDQTEGEFVIYDNGQNKIKGLKVDSPWSGLSENSEYEIGTKTSPIDEYFNGKYTQASKRILSKEELQKMSNSDLKMMRNEIFARYGYCFSPGGEMDHYFKKQEWYSAQYKNVNEFLTELEKENIKRIIIVEKETK